MQRTTWLKSQMFDELHCLPERWGANFRDLSVCAGHKEIVSGTTPFCVLVQENWNRRLQCKCFPTECLHNDPALHDGRCEPPSCDPHFPAHKPCLFCPLAEYSVRQKRTSQLTETVVSLVTRLRRHGKHSLIERFTDMLHLVTVTGSYQSQKISADFPIVPLTKRSLSKAEDRICSYLLNRWEMLI